MSHPHPNGPGGPMGVHTNPQQVNKFVPQHGGRGGPVMTGPRGQMMPPQFMHPAMGRGMPRGPYMPQQRNMPPTNGPPASQGHGDPKFMEVPPRVSSAPPNLAEQARSGNFFPDKAHGIRPSYFGYYPQMYPQHAGVQHMGGHQYGQHQAPATGQVGPRKKTPIAIVDPNTKKEVEIPKKEEAPATPTAASGTATPSSGPASNTPAPPQTAGTTQSANPNADAGTGSGPTPGSGGPGAATGGRPTSLSNPSLQAEAPAFMPTGGYPNRFMYHNPALVASMGMPPGVPVAMQQQQPQKPNQPPMQQQPVPAPQTKPPSEDVASAGGEATAKASRPAQEVTDSQDLKSAPTPTPTPTTTTSAPSQPSHSLPTTTSSSSKAAPDTTPSTQQQAQPKSPRTPKKNAMPAPDAKKADAGKAADDRSDEKKKVDEDALRSPKRQQQRKTLEERAAALEKEESTGAAPSKKGVTVTVTNSNKVAPTSPKSPSKDSASDTDNWENRINSPVKPLPGVGDKDKAASKEDKRPAPISISADIKDKPAVPPPADGGKRIYSRDELLAFQEYYKEKPTNLPSLDIVIGSEGSKDKEWTRGGSTPRSQTPRSAKGGRGGGLDFNRRDSMDPRGQSYGQGGGRGGRREGGRGGRRGGHQQPPLYTGPVAPLEHSENAWKPQKDVDESEAVYKRVKGLLNKLTIEKFATISDKLMDSGIDNVELLRGVIGLVFDKALSEPTFGALYADLCVKMSENEKLQFTDDNGHLQNFKRILLNKAQEEFEAKMDTTALETMQEEEKESAEFKLRRRMLGNIRFIGQLYKKKMLTEKIMHECIKKLLGAVENPVEEDVECLCQLMTTIGATLDNKKNAGALDAYFQRLDQLTKSEVNLSSRHKFMVRDVIDLRQNRWVPRRKQEEAKSINAIRAQAYQELESGHGGGRGGHVGGGGRGGRENFGGGRGGGERGGRVMPATERDRERNRHGGGDVRGDRHAGGGARNSNDGWTNVAGGNRRGTTYGGTPPEPPPRLEGDIVLGPQGMSSNWNRNQMNSRDAKDEPKGRSSSNMFNLLGGDDGGGRDRRDTDKTEPDMEQEEHTDGDSAAASMGATDEEQRKKIDALWEEYLSCHDLGEAIICVNDLNDSSYHGEVVAQGVISTLEKSATEQDLCWKLVSKMHDEKLCGEEDASQALDQVFEIIDDVIIDAPKAGEILAKFVARCLVKGVISVDYLSATSGLKSADLVEFGRARELFVQIWAAYRAETSPEQFREMYAKSGLELMDYVCPKDQEVEFLTRFLQSKDMLELCPTLGTEQELAELFTKNAPVDEMVAYVKSKSDGVRQSPKFARLAMRLVLDHVLQASLYENGKLVTDGADIKARVEKEVQLAKLYAPFLRAVTGDELPSMLQLLFELQVQWLEISPRHGLGRWFDYLYEYDVVVEDAINAWKEDLVETNGKKEALVSALKFLKWLDEASGDSEDDAN